MPRELVPYRTDNRVIDDTFKRLQHVGVQFGRLGGHLASIASNQELDRNVRALAQENFMADASQRTFDSSNHVMDNMVQDASRMEYFQRFPGQMDVLRDQSERIMSDWPAKRRNNIPPVLFEALLAGHEEYGEGTPASDLTDQIDYATERLAKNRAADRLYDTNKREYYKMLQDHMHPLYNAAMFMHRQPDGFTFNVLHDPEPEIARIRAQYAESDRQSNLPRRLAGAWKARTVLRRVRRNARMVAAREGVDVSEVWDRWRDLPAMRRYYTQAVDDYMAGRADMPAVLRSLGLRYFRDRPRS